MLCRVKLSHVVRELLLLLISLPSSYSVGRSVVFFSRSHGTCDFIIRSGEDGLLVGCELNREKNMKTMKG